MSSILHAHAYLHVCEMKNMSCQAHAARMFYQVLIELYHTYYNVNINTTLHKQLTEEIFNELNE